MRARKLACGISTIALVGAGLLGMPVLLGGLCACSPHVVDPGPPSTEGAFGPESLRVYPLTRLDRSADGKPIVICHIELKDRWGDTTKGVGKIVIRLMRATPAPTAGESSDQTWELDLSNWELNASLYDRATRTYRIQLGELPAWLAEQTPVAKGKGEAKGDGAPACRLRASYTPRGSAATSPRLTDEFVVKR